MAAKGANAALPCAYAVSVIASMLRKALFREAVMLEPKENEVERR